MARDYESRLLQGISPERRAALDGLLKDLQQAAEAMYTGDEQSGN